jgi:S1-C subfamily serine protease
MPSRRSDDDGDSSRERNDHDTPRRRKPTSGRDYDDDDVPRRRTPASRRDDDDEDERPSRSRRTKGVHPAVYVGAGVVIALAAGGVIWAVAGKGKPRSQEPAGQQTVSNTTTGPAAPTAGDRDKRSPEAKQATPTTGDREKFAPEVKTTPTAATPPNAVANAAPPSSPPAKTLASDVGPPAVGELSSEMGEKIKRATALIRVTAGDYRASGSGFILRSNGDTAYVLTNYHVVATPPEEPAPKTPPKTNPQPKGPPGFRGAPRPPSFPNPSFPHPSPPNLPGTGFRGGPGSISGIGRPSGFGILGAPGMGPPNLGLPGFNQPSTPEAKKPDEPARPRPRVTVVLCSGTPEEQSVQAELVAFDDEADLAALRITGVRNLPAAIDVSQEAPLAETMPVYIFGFPGGVRSVELKRGTVSQIRRDANNEVRDLQINGDIIPGNSGGPIVDAKGRLVGIAVSTVRGKNVGFAVPTDQLNHMLSGSIKFGLVGLISKQGNSAHLAAEVWEFDGANRVREHETLRLALGQNNRPVPSEFLVLGRLTDPMHRINSAAVHFAVIPPGTRFTGEGRGWPALKDARKLPLELSDQNALGSFKLPQGATQDDNYAFQFSYVNADGQTVYTQPHQFRLTFSKNKKTVSPGPPNDPAAPVNPAKDPPAEPKKSTPLDPSDGFVFCSELKTEKVKNGAWPVTKGGRMGNKAIEMQPENAPIVVKGERCPEGIAMHPPAFDNDASVEFRLGGKAKRFLSRVALNDTAARPQGRGVFSVYGDGRELWKSGEIGRTGQVETCDIDVTGVEVLELRTTKLGSPQFMHMVWLDPRVRTDKGAAADLLPKARDAKR